MASQLVINLCAFIWTILMARYLGKSDFGILSFAISISTIVSVFMDLGMNTYIVRAISRDDNLTKRYFEKCVPLKILLSCLVIIFTILFLFITGRSSIIINVSFILLLQSAFYIFCTFLYGVFQAYEKLEYQSVATMINAIILLGIVFLTIYLDLGIFGMAFAYLIAMFCALVYIFSKIRKLFVKINYSFDLNFSKEIIKVSLPFGLMSVFYLIYFNIDMAMLEYLSAQSSVGMYNAAYKIITLLTAFYSIYPSVIFPVMSKLFGSSKDLLRLSYEKSIKYLLLVILPVSAGIIIYAVPLMNFIYGSQYYGTGPIVTLLIFTIPFLFVNGASSVAMNSSNNEIKVTKIYGLAAFANIILNFILIPNYSYIGAAVATVISDIIICILMFRITINSEYAPRMIVVYDVIKLLISSLVMFAVLYYSELNIILGVIVGGIVYIGMLFITRTLDEDDKNIIKNIIGG